jgi:hypothetical protein
LLFTHPESRRRILYARKHCCENRSKAGAPLLPRT